jgi:uncharacterized protein YegP (UPF0339 family)
MKYILQQTEEGLFFYVAKNGSTTMFTSEPFKHLKNAKKSIVRTINAHMHFFKKSGVKLSWHDVQSRVTINF